MFTVTPNPDARISAYANSNLVQSASFKKSDGCYHYVNAGQKVACGGLIKALEWQFYPNYKNNRSKRKWKRTKVRGSTKEQGKIVDSGITKVVGTGKRPARLHKMSAALLDYWKVAKHTLQAAQLPVVVGQWNKMTQADLITRNEADGSLWLWEIKTGFPVGGFRHQGTMRHTKDVPCTKYNIWQLQLHYTKLALQAAGVEITHSRIIQIYTKEKKLQIKVHEPADWLLDLPRIVPQKIHKPKVL